MHAPTDVKRNPYTQKAIERAIRAAQACGLKVVAVRPDGTVLTGEVPDEERPPLSIDEQIELGRRLGSPLKRKPVDARAKLWVYR